MSITIVRASKPRLEEAARDKSDFGTVFTDHMLVAECDSGVWDEPKIVPYGPLPMAPSLIALHYGQTCFEGFKARRTVDGGIALFRPRDNHARMNRTAARLAMPEIPADIFLDGIATLVRLEQDWVPERPGSSLYLRPVYFAADEAIGVRAARAYRFVVLCCPVGRYFHEPIRLLAEEHYVRAFPGGTGDVKAAGNYAGSLVAARLAQEHGFHNVIWLDGLEHRFVEECGVMNIVFVIGGVAVTPPLGGTILPGITRDSVLTLLREMSIPIQERPVRIDEIFAAHAAGTLDEAFGVGTAATIAPIACIRFRDREIEIPTGLPGSVSEKASAALDAVQTGRDADHHGWLLPV